MSQTKRLSTPSATAIEMWTQTWLRIYERGGEHADDAVATGTMGTAAATLVVATQIERLVAVMEKAAGSLDRIRDDLDAIRVGMGVGDEP